VSSDGASTYSTGGGGVTLEHQYVATLLAALLVGDPTAELGDRVALTAVRLQASDVSAVDDLVLEGIDPAGASHRASIGVRRDPQLTTSDTKSVPLVRAYLEVVTDHWADVSTGRWSLTLAVAKARPTFQQVADLAALARAVPDAAAFAAAVARPAATNAATRGRLDHLRALVSAASDGHAALTAVGIDELTWRWLSTLKVRVLRLEGAETTDRTTAVAALQRSVLDGTTASADSVFSRLSELAGAYATRGARVTVGMLRRELSTYPLKRLGAQEAAWRVFDRLHDRLRDQTRSTITTTNTRIEIDRSDAANSLREAIEAAATTGGALVITGEPDVGKSALAVRVSDELRAAGAVVVAISLGDSPTTVLDLEHAFGGLPLGELFGGAATGSVRVLVIDGCEAVLEGKEPVFVALAAAAAQAGFAVAAVTRVDGSRYVCGAVDRALQSTGRGTERAYGRPANGQPGDRTQPVEDGVDDVVADALEYAVDELSASERAQLVDAVEVLARLQADPRAAWLLGRPGLVDALLRSDAPLEPGRLLCEADVYAAVWNGLIRRRETNPPGTASPDDRASTVVAVAGRRLGGTGAPDGQALRELRSDGVLRIEANPAFSQGPEFSTDLYRDFGLCRLFLDAGWQPLKEAGLPRWPIRAARLACQARLSTAGPGDLVGVWSDLMSEFGDLAAVDGARWTEVPYEALLTLGDARVAIAALWDALIADDGLATLLRLADARYAKGTIGDPHALAPVVEVAFCDKRMLGRHRRGTPSTPQEQVAELVLAWLRGVATGGRGPDPLRRRVRDTILDQDRPVYDAFAVEALATLGPDLDARAEQWLRKVAEDRPSALYPVAEAPLTVVSMAHDSPELLLELSEAYYIEQPEELGWRGGPLDDGIRDHRHGLEFGFGPPQAAWYYGPFFRLLKMTPLKAIGFINRMLNHAALHRVADHPSRDLGTIGSGADWDDYDGVTLELTEATGRRHYVGDSHVWCWYRGTSVGPYACMSALLALEKYTDHLYETLELPADKIADILLKDCHNLAVPGMLAGFLIRHLDGAGSLLDPYLANVDIWHLETTRATGEHGFRVRDPDADTLTGHDHRRFTPHEVVGYLVVNARLRGDETRLAELEHVGERLVESARAAVASHTGETSEPGADPSEEAAEYLAVAQSWGAEFRIDSYGVTEVDDGIVVQFERPAEIAEALADSAGRLETTQVLYGLQSRYALKNETPEQWPVDTLKDDIATAKALLENGPTDGFMWPENPLVAVAAAAIRAHVTGALELDVDDLEWAAGGVLYAAQNPRIDGVSIPSTMFHMGADRAAAIAVPLLLLRPCDQLDLDPKLVDDGLRAVATSMFDEVRTSFAMGCDLVWAAPCDLDVDGTCHRHATAWAAVEHGLSDCVLGPWSNEEQRRPPAILEPPYPETLPAVPDEDLLVNRLRMPLVCLAGAAKAACLAEVTRELAGPLWDAHRRGLDHWWREGYDHLGQRHHEPVARVLIEAAIGGDRTALDDHLRTFASNSHAMQMFMDSLAMVFSYDDRLRASLATVWVPSLATVLDAIEDGADLADDEHSWFDWAVASLLPTPQMETADLDPAATLNRCRDSWADPNEFAELFDGWAALAKGEPRAADAVAQLARTAHIAWQAKTGLDWLEVVLDGRHDEFANRVWFVTNWLGELRSAGAVTGDVVATFHRIVDGLAAGGDRAAVGLQLLDE
jgi:hypothetical protein